MASLSPSFSLRKTFSELALKPYLTPCLKPCTAAVALAMLSMPALAQAQQAEGSSADNPMVLESIQVTGSWLGSGLQNSVKNFPGARTVVKKEDIDDTGAMSIGDVMRRIPGVQITDNSGTAGSAISL